MLVHKEQQRLIFGKSLGALAFVLAVVLVLTIPVLKSSQAQTFTILHEFSGGR